MFKILFQAVLVVLATVGAAGAAERATLQDARAMAERAAQLMHLSGPQMAYAAFNDKSGTFQNRDLYVFVLNKDGVMLAHGADPSLIGRDLIGLKDVTGKPFVKEMLGIKDSGWVSYHWLDPLTRTVEPKTSYVIRVDDDVVGVGAYEFSRGSAEEAKTLVAHAIALYDRIGATEAFHRINAHDGDFMDRDLYVAVIGPSGLIVAQADDERRVGLDANAITDIDGKPYGRALIDQATADGAWIDYRRKDPLTGEIEAKSSWAVLHDHHIFLCGIYTPKTPGAK